MTRNEELAVNPRDRRNRAALSALSALLGVLLAAPALALEHSGTAAGTWTAADSPHVITGDLLVPAGEVLAIEPGAVVTFFPGLTLDVEGTLAVNGAPDRRVALRSHELQPRAGDWGGLRIARGGAAWISHADLRHALKGVEVAGGGSLDAQATSFADSLDDGVSLAAEALAGFVDCSFERNGAAGLRLAGGAPLVSGCAFQLNDVALAVAANAFPLVIDCTASANRTLDGILVDDGQELLAGGTWSGGGLPWVLGDDATLRVASASGLRLGPGAVVKLGERARLEVAGRVIADGEPGRSVVLTSLADDAVLGDTNADGGASAPAKGDWSGIDVASGGVLTLANAELRHADDAVRVLTGGGVSLVGVEIHSSAQRGLALGSGTTALLQDCSFHDNATGVEVSDPAGVAMGRPVGSEPAGGGNSFHCHSGFDVENLSAVVLPAHRNYWGSTPPDPSTILGPVDTGEFLIDAPGSALRASCLEVARQGGADLLFRWAELSTCASYQVAAADEPNGVFGPLGGPTTEETHLEVGAATASGLPVRYFRLLSGL